MNTINLKLEVSLNGAQVFPTVKQYAQLQEAASNILLGQGEEAPVKEKRAYTTRKKRGVSWTPDEINLVLNRKLEGKGYSKIARELLMVFGKKRTVGTIAQIYYVNRRKPKADPNEVVANNVPPLKQNEWGGVEGLKSPELA